MIITNIELSENIKTYKTGAIIEFNETSWTIGKILYVQYRNYTGGKTYVLGAIGVGVGVGSQNYCIISDSEAIEAGMSDAYDALGSAYNTTVTMNTEQYNVLNNNDDTIVSDPFEVRNFNN